MAKGARAGARVRISLLLLSAGAEQGLGRGAMPRAPPWQWAAEQHLRSFRAGLMLSLKRPIKKI